MKAILKIIMPPVLIRIIKNTFACIGKYRENIPENRRIFSDPATQVFFGYYDISPFNDEGNFLLAGQAPPENVSPHDKHPVLQLGYYDLSQENSEFQKFSETDTWNWQQGCRLQWFSEGGRATDQVLYNVREEGKYIAVVKNISSGKVVKKLPLPIYALSPDASFALSLDFDRLHDCRPGYGYSHFPAAPRKDSIWHIDIASSKVSEVMTMAEVREFEPLPSMEGADHYFNHLSISPSGKCYMVTHLWVSPEGKRYTRIIVANSKGDKNYICPNNSGHTSHYCWQGDDQILVFGKHGVEKPVYHLYNIVEGTSEVVGEAALTQDGHPSFISEDTIITDTYPDYFRQQHLFHYRIAEKKNTVIGSFYTPASFMGEVRCDLHPRLNHKKDKACMDIVRDGRRAMCIVDVPKK